ncbi:cpna-4, partial [Pristionchus pacificus]
MNMVRIRRILDMRKELKAPPLLPPRIKNKNLECSDKNSRDIVIFHFQLRNTILTLTEPVILFIHESESGGREGPWKTIALSEQFFLRANELNDLPALFSTEFEFEIIQRLKIELCMGSNDSFVSIGSSFFTISQVINNRRLTVPLLSTSEGEEISVVGISSSIQFSPPPFQIQLEFHDLHRKFISDTSMLNLTVNEARKGKEIYRSEPQKSGNRIIWRPFVLSIQHEMEVIVITVLHRDEKSKNDICIGESQTTINQLERDSIEGRVYQMIRKDDKKEGRRSNGLLEVIRVTPLPIKSFLQLITTGTSLHISFAIDFSSTQDDFSPLFSTEPEFILRSIGDCIEDYVNKSISALGFGAKLPPIDRESQQFCLSLNTNPYCESIDGVINTLHRCIHTIRPSKNSHLSHVIYYASKMAIHANLKRSRDNTQYFILEVVQAVIFASKAPISIIFVGMGESNKDELAQLGKGGTRISYQGRRVTRDILH